MRELWLLLYTAFWYAHRFFGVVFRISLVTPAEGHPQQEHETSHGSMSRTRWAVDGDDDTVIEVNGRRFGSGDDGAPLLVRSRYNHHYICCSN